MKPHPDNTARRRINRLAFYASRAVLRTVGAVPVPAVFILGHMRSGSTLLTHLLLTHPEIMGLGERNSVYRSADDLDRLCLWTRASNHAPLRRLRYVTDQILHDRFIPEPALLQHPRVWCIFLIREPAASISSLVRLTQTYYEAWTVEKAADCYIQRLNTLAHQAETLRGTGRTFYLTHDNLIKETPATLQRLQGFLGLESGFSEKYPTHEFTGIRGDPTANIRSGQIVRDPPAAPLEISPEVLERAQHAYTACLQVLKSLGDGV